MGCMVLGPSSKLRTALAGRGGVSAWRGRRFLVERTGGKERFLMTPGSQSSIHAAIIEILSLQSRPVLCDPGAVKTAMITLVGISHMDTCGIIASNNPFALRGDYLSPN